MTGRKNWLGMLAAVLPFAFVLTGCPPEGGVNPEIKNLPPFEGEFVASEEEASALATGANAQIEAAITAAVAQGPQASMSRAVVSESGYFEYNGVRVDITVTGNTVGDNYPLKSTIKELVTVNGTYGGYRVKGRYDLNLNCTATSPTEASIKGSLDCVYTVSHNGKGMKLVCTGNVELTTINTYTYSVYYAVYDNNNDLQYNYNYKYSL
jgi:hypothetical protein